MDSAFLSPKACVVLIALFAIAVVLGITLAMMEERGKPLLDFFTCLSEAMMKITTWVIYLAPIGVFFLISGQGRRHIAIACLIKEDLTGFYTGNRMILYAV